MFRSQHLIENERSRKVLFFAYMRGGSTIGGEVFNQNDDALMWYEPGDAFFMAYYGIPEENLPQHDLYYRNRTRRYDTTITNTIITTTTTTTTTTTIATTTATKCESLF